MVISDYKFTTSNVYKAGETLYTKILRHWHVKSCMYIKGYTGRHGSPVEIILHSGTKIICT